MNNSSILELVNCAACRNFMLDSAPFCWTCKMKSPNHFEQNDSSLSPGLFKLDSVNPHCWPQLGDMSYKQQSYSEALIWYRRYLCYVDTPQNRNSLSIELNNAVSYIMGRIGRTLLSLHLCSAAELYLERSLLADEGSELCLKHLSRAEGEEVRNVNVSKALSRLAFAKSSLGKDLEAEECYKRAVVLLESFEGKQVFYDSRWEEVYVGLLKGYMMLLEKQERSSETERIKSKLQPMSMYSGVVP